MLAAKDAGLLLCALTGRAAERMAGLGGAQGWVTAKNRALRPRRRGRWASLYGMPPVTDGPWQGRRKRHPAPGPCLAAPARRADARPPFLTAAGVAG
jgi:hypothetical protein